jgi:hypothetical protein
MLRKLFRNLVPLALLVTSTILGGGVVKATTAPSDAGPVAVTMQQLHINVDQLPQLAGLKAGDPVIISDDGKVTCWIWQGTYTFYPAGSVVPVAAMYARWKDGIVALTPTPAPAAVSGKPKPLPPGTLDAHWVGPKYDQAGKKIADAQYVHTLVTDASDASVLRIPGMAWLFRVNAQGQYTSLVDTFVFQAGSKPQQIVNKTGSAPTYIEQGSQPVPVAATYWHP